MVTTACVIDNQMESASAALRAMLAEAEKTRKATVATPTLWHITYTLKRVISEVEEEGAERFDPEFAGLAAEKFSETSRIIQQVIAASDHMGIFDRIPAKVFFHRLQSQGRRLGDMALVFRDIDEHWHAYLRDSAKSTLNSLREAILNAKDSDDCLDLSNEELDRPSDEALRAHLHRTVSSTRQ